MGSLLLAVLAVGVLIIVHEAGHFLAARWSGMRVSRFSIGFGPPLAKFERGETVYQIGVLPLGGFVQIDGMSPNDGTDPTHPASYLNRPFHQRFAAILAGPAANYLLAFLLLVVASLAFRSETLPPVEVLQVQDGSPAAEAGLKEGDLILGVGGVPFEAVGDLLKATGSSEGRPLALDVERGGVKQVIEVTPRRDGDGPYRVGVAFGGSVVRALPGLPFTDALALAGRDLYAWSAEFIRTLSALVDIKNLQGPLGIVSGLADNIQRAGAGALPFIARISVILGIANLLPIPGLDGSRLLFLLVGVVRRKPVPPRLEAGIHAVGVILLLLLLVVISINDVLREVP
ncbi:MAG: site-2 protease family protein [Deltaproteobacteria bacterium]|nr:site-2 protease family protein [Deltaproteobacteria bacterium]